jgi:hypothetical protein
MTERGPIRTRLRLFARRLLELFHSADQVAVLHADVLTIDVFHRFAEDDLL